MMPGRVEEPMEMYEGDEMEPYFFRLKVNGEYKDLTGLTGRAVGKITDEEGVEAFEFVVQIPDQTLVPGGVVLTLDAAQTANLGGKEGLWDFQLEGGPISPQTWLKGAWVCESEVTEQ